MKCGRVKAIPFIVFTGTEDSGSRFVKLPKVRTE